MNTRFDELLKKLNDADISQTEGCWDEEIPDEIWNEFFENNHEELAEGLDVDTHRWYELSTTVVGVCGGLLGIRMVTNIFSESMDYADCGEDITFFEMKEVKTVTYVEKD